MGFAQREEDEFQPFLIDTMPKIKKMKEYEIAEEFLNKYKVVHYQNKLYWLDDSHYIQDDNELKRLVFAEVGNKKTDFVDEVIKQLKYRAPIINPNQAFDIKLKNGILRDGKFIAMDYQEFTPYNIDIPYNPDAQAVAVVDDYINHLTDGDKDYRKRLLEIMAHPLIVDKEFKRMLAKLFIFIGDGGNGKGTLLYIIRTILNNHNCSALSIKQMTDERYFTTLQGKLCNLGDDVQDEMINNDQMKMLKNISTCDYVSTRNLFEQSKDVELTVSLIFTSNHILRSFEKGESYKRRVDWCPIFAKPKQKDRYFIKKLTTPEALEYWIKLIVEAYERLYQNQGFTESEIVKKFNQEYHEQNNTALEYLNDCTKEELIDRRSPEVYGDYTIWAEENDLYVQSLKIFKQSVNDVFGLTIQKKDIKDKKGKFKTSRVYQEAKTEEKL